MRPELRIREKERVVTTYRGTILSDLVSLFQPKVVSVGNITVKASKVKKVNKLLDEYYHQSRVYAVDVIKLYQNIPSELVTAVEGVISSHDISMTYEEILKMFMELARYVNNPVINGLDALPKLDDFFKLDLISVNSYNINRGSLAVVWSALLLNLWTKYTLTVTETQRKNIVKGSIALALGIGVGFLQFCHKSPESPTSYIRLAYEVYNDGKSYYNKLLHKIPDPLVISRPIERLSSATDNEIRSTGQMLNMVYTFRIGDIFLSVLEEERPSMIFDTTMEKIINAIWPLPTQTDIKRIFRLYTEDNIYNI